MNHGNRAPDARQYRSRLRRLADLVQVSAARSGRFNLAAIAKDLLHETSAGQSLVVRFAPGNEGKRSREYAVKLPEGYPAREIHIRLSTPRLPASSLAGFSDHVLDAQGQPTETVAATMAGGFALSRDLGKSWQIVKVRDRHLRRHQFLHMKSIGNSEFVAQAEAKRWQPGAPREIHNLVLNEKGDVLAAQRMNGSHWHGCRSVDIANGTLMFAEYPYEDPAGTAADRASSRVLRSRDRGRTWETVFERNGAQVRHFHFLQARPGAPREWWLASGDHPLESRIWVSRDDGDTWEDITGGFGDTVLIDGLAFPRSVFRLTDLTWEGGRVVWGTDDSLMRNQFPSPGARMFRSDAGKLAPAVAGKAKWPIRNIVDIGPFYMVLTQGFFRPDAPPQDKMPGVYLMPKEQLESAPGMVHLFDVEVHSRRRTGFTYSRASRAAKDGTFFTYRASTDAFPFGHKILKWDVALS